MLKKTFSLVAVLLIVVGGLFAQKSNLSGQVTSGGEGLPYVNIMIKGTTLGVATDMKGNYHLTGIPVGRYTIEAQAVGFKKASVEVVVKKESISGLNFELSEDKLLLEQVVVTANRDDVSRVKAPVIVNTLSSHNLEAIQSTNVSEGLNFLPGLRTENNCQNCGFTQLRMNGMEGAYSQVLVNGRPVFSGLAGVYGLEIMPSGMIERLEVIRGGGSALYGSNAIAGTVNVITKDPISNSYAIKLSQQVVGVGIDGVSPANDYLLNFNNSLVGKNARNGMALYGFLRHRNPFDANGDGYSEAPKIDNFTLGGRFYQRLGVRGKITADLYAINAERRGGNDFDLLLHEADIAEAVDHKIYSGSFTFERFFREIDQFSAYVSVQTVDRDSYYGAEQALDAYGRTSDLTYVTGVQYNSHFGKFNVVSGIENQGGFLKDTKLGYIEFLPETGTILHVPNSIVADQLTNTTGAFAQADYRWKIIKGSVGLRYDHYLIRDNYSETDDVVGNAISPRLNLLVDVLDHMQARLSYSQGYRAPQVFDEDLHIEASGARKVIHKNSVDLKQESSHSFIASLDYHPHTTNCDMQLLVEAFCTRLIDPFSNEFGDMDETGTVVYSRVNADGYAQVFGANFELNLIVSDKLNLGSGFTVQRSEYSTPQEFNETKFFRTPDNYGFLTAQIIPTDNWRITLTENYTGEMLVPYFGTNTADIETGELRTSDIFFDTGIKICYEVRMKDLNMNIFTGVKNIFNSYQNDFDIGVNRDPAYVYGPIQPRTFYFGVKFGHYKA